MRMFAAFVTTLVVLVSMTETGSAQVVAVTPPTLPGTSDGRIHDAINMCPIAPAFGVISVNYEHLFGQKHGVVVRFDHEIVPSSYSDANIESSGNGLMLNYRFHLSGFMESTFVGAYARYRVFDGTGTSGTTDFDTTLSEQTLGVNIGKRWIWNGGFNVTFGVGYGFSRVDEDAQPTDDAIAQAVSVFRDEYPFFNPAYGELSIGYAF